MRAGPGRERQRTRVRSERTYYLANFPALRPWKWGLVLYLPANRVSSFLSAKAEDCSFCSEPSHKGHMGVAHTAGHKVTCRQSSRAIVSKARLRAARWAVTKLVISDDSCPRKTCLLAYHCDVCMNEAILSKERSGKS
jgi:hypothetical protein